MDPDGGIDRFLPWRKVRDITGLGRTTAWRLRRAGDFPHPVPISPGRVAWRERDIAHWNETRGSPDAIPVLRRPAPAPAPETRPRPPEPRVLPEVSPASPVLKTAPPPAPDMARRKTPRRSRSAIAEGQLGFDF